MMVSQSVMDQFSWGALVSSVATKVYSSNVKATAPSKEEEERSDLDFESRGVDGVRDDEEYVRENIENDDSPNNIMMEIVKQQDDNPKDASKCTDFSMSCTAEGFVNSKAQEKPVLERDDDALEYIFNLVEHALCGHKNADTKPEEIPDPLQLLRKKNIFETINPGRSNSNSTKKKESKTTAEPELEKIEEEEEYDEDDEDSPHSFFEMFREVAHDPEEDGFSTSIPSVVDVKDNASQSNRQLAKIGALDIRRIEHTAFEVISYLLSKGSQNISKEALESNKGVELLANVITFMFWPENVPRTKVEKPHVHIPKPQVQQEVPSLLSLVNERKPKRSAPRTKLSKVAVRQEKPKAVVSLLSKAGKTQQQRSMSQQMRNKVYYAKPLADDISAGGTVWS